MTERLFNFTSNQIARVQEVMQEYEELKRKIEERKSVGTQELTEPTVVTGYRTDGSVISVRLDPSHPEHDNFTW